MVSFFNVLLLGEGLAFGILLALCMGIGLFIMFAVGAGVFFSFIHSQFIGIAI